MIVESIDYVYIGLAVIGVIAIVYMSFRLLNGETKL